MQNEPNFNSPKNAVSLYPLKSKVSSLKTGHAKNEPNRTQFIIEYRILQFAHKLVIFQYQIAFYIKEFIPIIFSSQLAVCH